ncbi:hypothetical protein FQZ97_837490 [compost metagenome]
MTLGYVAGQVQADILHHLRLDRQDDHICALDGLGIAGEGFDAMFCGDFRALLGAAVAGANGAGLDALGAQTADQAGSHVAGADKGNAGSGHSGLPY